MKPPDKIELEKKHDIKTAIEAHDDIGNTNKALNDSYSQFVNSTTIPEAMIRAAADVPTGLIKMLVFKYVKTINSILSKTLFYLGVELGSTGDDIKEKASEATKKVKFLTQILIMVLNDPQVKDNVRLLAIDLNSAVLQPFLKAALITLEEMSPQIEIAGEKLEDRIHEAARKITDATGNGILSGLGTVPYVGNILNATELLANTSLGVQGIVDEFVGAILDQTLQTLIILQKIGGPGTSALDSWINFAINANNAMTTFKNQYDNISANMNTKNFTPDPLKSREALMNKAKSRVPAIPVVPAAIPVVPAIPVSPNKNIPIAPAAGGRRKRRRNKTRKKNQKKSTKYRKKSRRK